MSNFNRSPPVSGGGSNRFMSPLEEERSKNGSNAFFSPASQGSSSKAVLAALRALQDKIKRLESDKVQAEEETKHLRNQIHNKEAEFDYQKQREKMTLQRNLNETKIDYDKALIQKTKLESRLQELEDLNHELRSNTDGLVATVRNLEDDKYHKDMTLQDLQSKLLHLEMQIEVSQQRERELAHTIATETRQFDHQREAFANQLKDAQQELLEIKHTRHTHEQRIHELDELSRQLLNLNDALVAKLSHSSQANTSLRKLLGITKKVHIPAPTASAKMRHKSPVHTQEEISIKEKALFGDNEIENLQAIHDMYRGLAKSLVETRSPLVSINTDSLKKRLKSARNRKNDPFEKSLSSVKPIQFYLTNQSQSDDPAYDSDETDSALVIAEDLRSASLDRSHREFLNASMRPRSPELERKLNQGPNSLQTLHIKSTTSSPPTDHTYNYNHNNNNHHNIHYQTPNGKNVELVIKSLEDEFESLTTQYRQILATMQQDPDVSRPGLPESSLRNSEQLISVIQQLQRKGEQLRALKT